MFYPQKEFAHFEMIVFLIITSFADQGNLTGGLLRRWCFGDSAFRQNTI